MLVIVSEMGRGRRRSSAGGWERRFHCSARSSIKRLFEGLKLNWRTHARARKRLLLNLVHARGQRFFFFHKNPHVKWTKTRKGPSTANCTANNFCTAEEFLTNPWNLFPVHQRAHTEHQEWEKIESKCKRVKTEPMTSLLAEPDDIIVFFST